jgi:hypothetical protein
VPTPPIGLVIANSATLQILQLPAFTSDIILPTDSTRSLGGNQARSDLKLAMFQQPLVGFIATTKGENISIFLGSSFDGSTLSKLAQDGIHYGEQTGHRHIVLNQGFVLFAPNSDIVVTTQEGDIDIKAGAIALIFEDGHDVAIMDLSDNNPGDIKVAGPNQFALVPGQQVVLTRNASSNLVQINPASSVALRRTAKVQLNNGITAYASEFSIPSALNTANLYRQLLQDAPRRTVLNKILHAAACVQMVTANHGPYTVERLHER